jgi:hypothetical protein
LTIANSLRLSGRRLRVALEIALFRALIPVTRCANFQDVFVGGRIYFVDADCYARMTRARMVAEHPGVVVGQRDFENFPAGTIPHATAPLDYLIVGLSWALSPLTAQPLDLAGAIISPFLALAGGAGFCGGGPAALPGRGELPSCCSMRSAPSSSVGRRWAVRITSRS